MPHPNEPSLERLKEMREAVKDAKKSSAINKQIARREAHESAKQKSIPKPGAANSSGD